MLAFDVDGMSCGHCVEAVTRAVHSVDPKAQVAVDLQRGRVEAQTGADAQVLIRAITEAGYAARPSAAEPAGRARRSGCCGGR